MKIHWKYLSVTLAIGWFLGAASGILIAHFCPMIGSHPGRGRMRERLFNELNLTAVQRTQVGAILDGSHQKLDQIFTETKSRVDEVRKTAHAQIRQLLTPDQRAVFDKLDIKMQARFEKRFEDIRNKWH